MPGVRNTVLAHGRFATGLTRTLFTVSSGYTVLVKSANLWSYATAAADVVLAVRHPPAVAVWVAGIATTSGKGVAIFPWFAIDPGGELQIINGTNGDVSYYVSGAVLPGVVPPWVAALPAGLQPGAVELEQPDVDELADEGGDEDDQ